jgi:hypothetical protein
MDLLERLKSEAVKRGLLEPEVVLDPANVFAQVRDMPYHRASNRRPETILAEWRGTCSGKHYLLKALYAEMGLRSQIMACTTVVPVDPAQVPEALQPLYEASNRRFVDVHNYLILYLPDGRQMTIDATWPLATRAVGRVVNETFTPGQDQQLAAEPLQTWPIPEGQEPQDFKDHLLRENFTPAELEFRELVIQAVSEPRG